jgi:hypothetical protein
VTLEDAAFGQGHREVQARLPPERREESLGALDPDDALEDIMGERLDVGSVGHLRVRHDRGGVRVHEHDLEPFLPERLHGLRARVVELASLADHDRPRPDQQDFPDVSTLGHQFQRPNSWRSSLQQAGDKLFLARRRFRTAFSR